MCVSVYLSVYVSVTVLMATYLVYMSKVRQNAVSCKLLKICIVWTSLKRFVWEIWRYLPATMTRQLGSFSTKNTPMVLDTIRNGTVYEPLAKSDDYLK